MIRITRVPQVIICHTDVDHDLVSNEIRGSALRIVQQFGLHTFNVVKRLFGLIMIISMEIDEVEQSSVVTSPVSEVHFGHVLRRLETLAGYVVVLMKNVVGYLLDKDQASDRIPPAVDLTVAIAVVKRYKLRVGKAMRDIYVGISETKGHDGARHRNAAHTAYKKIEHRMKDLINLIESRADRALQLLAVYNSLLTTMDIHGSTIAVMSRTWFAECLLCTVCSSTSSCAAGIESCAAGLIENTNNNIVTAFRNKAATFITEQLI